MAEALAYCLGIDGGGTKTEGVLTDLEGRVLARVKSGASYPNDVGFTTSVRLLADMIRALLCEGNAPADRVSVFAGIAGALALRDAMRDAIRAEIPTLGALAVDSDFINLLSAATPSGQGICLICGTGSVCFARGSGQLWLQCVVDDSPFVFCMRRKDWKSSQAKLLLSKIGEHTEIQGMKEYNGYTGKMFLLYFFK